jgi:hypothetical protein
MKMILNLTQHQGTPEQGVTELPEGAAALVRSALTFEDLPDLETIQARAKLISEIAASQPVTPGEGKSAMIGGAPFLMGALEAALRASGIRPVYAFSRRESVDQAQEDGSVRKVAVFRHLGWVEM